MSELSSTLTDFFFCVDGVLLIALLFFPFAVVVVAGLWEEDLVTLRDLRV